MLKGIGMMLVFCGCVGMGQALAGECKKRIRQLKYVKKMLYMLRGEIQYAKAPLPEAFQNIGQRLEEPFSEFFLKLSKELYGLTGKRFSEIWTDSIRTYLKDSGLSKKDLQQLERLGENFGYLDENMQLNTIQLYMEQLELEIRQGEQDVANKTRIYQCLGVMAGLFAIVLSL